MNDISTEMASQLAEAAQLLVSTADRLAYTAGDLEDTQCKLDDVHTELEDIQYKLSKANAELNRLACPHEHADSLHEHADSWLEDDDSLLDPEDYLTVPEIAWLARYYMPREKAEGIPVPKLQKLLYKVSVADGCPIMLRDQELAFHRGIASACLKKIAGLKDSYMPSVFEGEDEF